jgi:TIR domain
VDWERDIQQSLESCSSVLLVGSGAAFSSEYVNREWRTAHAAGKGIVVALVETAEVPVALQDPSVSLVDCRADFDRSVELLAACLQKGVVHRDLSLRTHRVPQDVALVAHTLLWSSLYNVAVAVLVVI